MVICHTQDFFANLVDVIVDPKERFVDRDLNAAANILIAGTSTTRPD